MNATAAAAQAFRLAYSNPALEQGSSAFISRRQQYDLLWSFYNNSVLDDLEANWGPLRGKQKLYRDTRSLYNPTKRLVEFYAAQMYPGALSEDGSQLPEGVRLAIPFARDTSPDLLKAIAQFWQWSNWLSWKSVHVRWGAALGSVFIEVIDDVEAGRVYAEVVWPGHLADLKLDQQGNVKSYVIQYLAQETIPGVTVLPSVGLGAVAPYRQYTYCKAVDENEIRFFKDGQPFDYTGNGAVIPNPYGFAPAVWIKHNDAGGIHGQPAVSGSLNKILQLNSTASHLHDHQDKVIDAPLLIATPQGGVKNLFEDSKKKRDEGGVDDYSPIRPSDRESLLMLKAPQGTTVASLVGNLNIAESLQTLEFLMNEIEADNPELNFYKELRSMSQLTGPAAARVMGDVEGRVSDAASHYDQGNLKLFQMAVAIGGFRANSGAWGSYLSRQQEKFLPFNLESYARGDLDTAILPRPLLTPTEMEKAAEEQAKAQAASTYVGTGVPVEIALKRAAGWTEEEVAEMQTLKQQQEAQAQAQAQQQQQQQQPAGQEQQPSVGDGNAKSNGGGNASSNQNN